MSSTKKAGGGYRSPSNVRHEQAIHVTYADPKVKKDCDSCGSKQVKRCRQTYLLKCAHCDSVWE